MFLSLHTLNQYSRQMEPSDEFITKVLNLWFYKEPPTENISNGLKQWGIDLVRLIKYGDDAIFSHPKIHEIIQLCKDFGLIDYEKNIMELYYEGKMRVQLEIRELWNNPKISMEAQALFNVMGELIKKIQKSVEKQIKKEQNAIPFLSNMKPFKN